MYLKIDGPIRLDHSTDLNENMIPAKLREGISYEDYRTTIGELVAAGETSGDNQSEANVEYTKLNYHRMKRLDKTFSLNDALAQVIQSIPKKQIWLVLSEAWCGDAAQNVPAFNAIANHSDKIELKILFRDQHLDLMDLYLTNGGRSIPKLVIFDAESLTELGTWGPRPEPAQALFKAFKADDTVTYHDFQVKLHGWYARNKTEALQQELSEIINESIKVVT